MDDRNMEVWLGQTHLTRLFFKSKISNKEFEFAEAYVNVSRQKTIVKTSVVGKDGSVKEFISNNDFTLDIQIALKDEDDNDIYPIDQLNDFAELLAENRELKVGSEFLDAFKITEIVIINYNVPQQTYSNRQNISIQAESDTPYLMRLKQNE